MAAALTFPLSFSDAIAHQPLVVKDSSVIISDPEVSKAYYDELQGMSRSYNISSDAPFKLYISIAVPKTANPLGRYSASIYDVGEKPRLIAAFESLALIPQLKRDFFGRSLTRVTGV